MCARSSAPQVYFLAFLSEPAEGDTRARVTLVLRYAAAEGMPAPLYDVTVDMDVHPHLAAPAKARRSVPSARQPVTQYTGGQQ